MERVAEIPMISALRRKHDVCGYGGNGAFAPTVLRSAPRTFKHDIQSCLKPGAPFDSLSKIAGASGGNRTLVTALARQRITTMLHSLISLIIAPWERG